jgi:hypothetical protein
MHYDADVGYLGQFIDVKVYDEELMHHFMIGPKEVDYRIARDRGYETIVKPIAELQEHNDEKILIKTVTHYFEIVKVTYDYGKWQAYKSIRK